MIAFRCPCCQQALQVADELAGGVVACIQCGERVRVPKAHEALPLEPPKTSPPAPPQVAAKPTPAVRTALPIASARRRVIVVRDKKPSPFTQGLGIGCGLIVALVLGFFVLSFCLWTP